MQIKLIHTLYAKNEIAEVIIARYVNNAQPAIRLITTEGEPLLTATANHNAVKNYGFNAVAIKNYSENKGILRDLVENKIISAEPLGTIESDFVKLPVHQLLIKETT